MTVKYNLDVSTSRPWTLFKLLFKWRGSVWKSVSFELLVWLIIYSIITIIYRCALNAEQMSVFEQFVFYIDGKLDYIPMDFMLGFFVTSVLSRWNVFFNSIGYIDNIALMTAAYIRGTDEKTKKMRRNIVRYCVLSQALVFRDISMRVRKRFPTLDTIVAAGFMMEHEKKKFEEIQYRYAKYWMPFQWALSLCEEARQQQRIASDYLLEKVGEEIKTFRTHMAILCNYDWVPLPIMYPQLIILSVHTYFLVCAISRQFIISPGAPNKSKIDIVFPVMTTLQFFFYVGWLKVAEVILNPFGEDDDDFEGNFLLDKNLTIGLTVVDEGYHNPPQLMKDMFWNQAVEPLYSAEAAHIERRMSGITGSIAHVVIPNNDHKMLPLSHVENSTQSLGGLLRRRSSAFNNSSTKRDQSAREGLFHMPSVFSEVKGRFARSMSHSHAFPPSGPLTDYRKNRSASNPQIFERRCKQPHRPLPEIFDDIHDDVSKSQNESYNIGESPVNITEPFSFMTTKLSAPHILEDLAEENEDTIVSRKNVVADQYSRSSGGLSAIFTTNPLSGNVEFFPTVASYNPAHKQTMSTSTEEISAAQLQKNGDFDKK